MENGKNKCFLTDHSNVEATIFCQECKLYLCNNCEKNHFELFKNLHHIYKLDKNIKEIFTGFCRERNHTEQLNYFCKNHNKLCCVKCIAKIKDEEYGQHTNCEVCKIKEIEEEKRNKLKDNIKILDNLSNNLDESINELKKIFEKINEEKENMKIKIQKIFTKL